MLEALLLLPTIIYFMVNYCDSLQCFENIILILLAVITLGLPFVIICVLPIFEKDQRRIPKNLGDRMKYYEELSEHITVIPSTSSFIVRIDIRACSKIASSLKKTQVYSLEFKRAMINTAIALRKEFRASTTYTHSDEITLIFNKREQEQEHIFGGRVFKLISVIPSYASSTFYKLLIQEKPELNHSISFDARILVFPAEKEYEIVNHMIWRSKGDCTRNFVAMYATKFLGKKTIQNMTTTTRIDELKKIEHDLSESGNVDFAMKHGTFVKMYNNSPMCLVFRNLKFSEDMLELLLAKSYNEKYNDLVDITYHESKQDNIEKLLNLPIPEKSKIAIVPKTE